MMKQHLGFFLNIAAIGLFVPGIILPMFSLNMDIMAQMSGSGLTQPILNKSLSLIGTIKELWQDERILVAVLIALFSIAIPIVKSLLITFAYFYKSKQISNKIYRFVSMIGKWSMADVFVVAIFLAVLSTNHAETSSAQQFAIFGFKIELMISTQTLSALSPGFYYFTAYCLLSLLATQLSIKENKTI